ncbi:glycosyltransferase family 4 protein [Pollutimonas sp. M17]|uniref:glycosyltransferase family 4 protein n=1 Tax=Pollutimonas sp. M17 TaxID=2962065 RepID=UPI0021F44E47|nr:glycosyltransferase family 1 protein [Pollutimonas sp. M17]UYO93966.1 glycosyltransferase family 4 protein [Pollutimonas sp. M17]
MKVTFDQQVFLLQEYGGISRYICSLARELATMPDMQAQVVAPLHFNRNLAALERVAGMRRFLPTVNTKLFRPVAFVSKHLARRSINRFRPDILHETYYSPDDYRPTGAKRVLTVYDLIHERYPELFERSHMTIGPKKAAAQRADHVICISESTRRDVIEYCGVAPEKTSVVCLGVDVGFIQVSEQTSGWLTPPRPFILYVGARGGYKNFDRLLRAFSRSARLKSEFDLICFGGGPLRSNELQAARELGLRQGQLTHRGGSDALLAHLYGEAEALVYPSLYEGFGIPPIEAMAVGCPVITSNTSSLPEVVGNAGEYFDPTDEMAITHAIEQVAGSPTRRAELVALGLKQCRKFTWEKCARETRDIYQKLL